MINKALLLKWRKPMAGKMPLSQLWSWWSIPANHTARSFMPYMMCRAAFVKPWSEMNVSTGPS